MSQWRLSQRGLSQWRMWQWRMSQWLMSQWQLPTPNLSVRMLQPLSWLYAALGAARRAMYRLGLRQALAPPCPVIVVGNLVVGGAGKTPAVIALVRWLRSQGDVPGVVSRGHGRSGRGLAHVMRSSAAQAVGDEPLLIHLRTGAAVVVGSDRAAAARSLCVRHPEVSVLVSDDGLQHHRLARSVEVLVFDDRGAGNGFLLPAGPLREPLPASIGPRCLVLYNASRPTTRLAGYVGVRRLSGVLRLGDWWADPLAAPQPLARLKGRRILAAVGLARPEAFFAMLEAQGLELRRLALPDHHDYAELPWPLEEPEVIVTEKDAVKLRPERVGATRIWVATLDFEPEPAFGHALLRLLPERA